MARQKRSQRSRGFIALFQSFSAAAIFGNFSTMLLVWIEGVRSLWPQSGPASFILAFFYTIPFGLNIPLLLRSFEDMERYRNFLIGLNTFLLFGISFWAVGVLKNIGTVSDACKNSLTVCKSNVSTDPIFWAILGVVVLTCIINLIVIAWDVRFTEVFFKSALPGIVLIIAITVAYRLNLFCLPPSISSIMQCSASNEYEVRLVSPIGEQSPEYFVPQQ